MEDARGAGHGGRVDHGTGGPTGTMGAGEVLVVVEALETSGDRDVVVAGFCPSGNTIGVAVDP
jgi:hypothetical protein